VARARRHVTAARGLSEVDRRQMVLHRRKKSLTDIRAVVGGYRILLLSRLVGILFKPSINATILSLYLEIRLFTVLGS
jgi:hypothetical protein